MNEGVVVTFTWIFGGFGVTNRGGAPGAICRGSGPEFSSSFFFSGGRPNFSKLSEEQKKQTDREQHKALFLTT